MKNCIGFSLCFYYIIREKRCQAMSVSINGLDNLGLCFFVPWESEGFFRFRENVSVQIRMCRLFPPVSLPKKIGSFRGKKVDFKTAKFVPNLFQNTCRSVSFYGHSRVPAKRWKCPQSLIQSHLWSIACTCENLAETVSGSAAAFAFYSSDTSRGSAHPLARGLQ